MHLLKQGCSDDLVHAVSALMGGFPAHWCVAGGWALDLFLGRVTRQHDDVEIAIFRQDQARLREYLRDWHFYKVVNGQTTAWPADEWLELPVHEIHARSIETGKSPRISIEFLLNERTRHEWVFRRKPSVRLPLKHAIATVQAGLPALSPEIVLLYKAKAPRAKDEADLRIVLPALRLEQQQWLRAALEVCHPRHPWL